MELHELFTKTQFLMLFAITFAININTNTGLQFSPLTGGFIEYVHNQWTGSDVGDNFRWGDVRDRVVRQILHFCGANRVCNRTGYEKAENIGCSPCDTCYCDIHCTKYGDCCPDLIIDYEMSDMYTNETFPDTDSTVGECMEMFFKGFPSIPDDPYNAQRLITKCPAHGLNETLLDLCDNSGKINQYNMFSNQTREAFMKNWPVISEVTSLSYKNRACAVCHNDDKNLIAWDVKILCGDPVPTSGFSSPEKMLDKILTDYGCPIAYVPPGERMSRTCNSGLAQKIYTNIDKCNTTGEYENYTSFLWETCEMFDLPFFKNSIEYRNIFCYACQEDGNLGGSPACGQSSSVPFFVVISSDALEQLQEARRRKECRCPDGYVYDVYKKTCRRIVCANGKIYSENKCVPKTKYSRGLAYSLSLRFMATLTEDDVIRLGATQFPSSDMSFMRTTDFIWASLGKKNFLNESRSVTLQIFNASSIVVPVEPGSNISIDIFTQVFIHYEVDPTEAEAILFSYDKQHWDLEIDKRFGMEFTSILIPNPTRYYPELPLVNQPMHFGVDIKDKRYEIYAVSISTPIVNRFHVVHVKEFDEVKNTLDCPAFIYDLNSDDDVMIVYHDLGGEVEGTVLTHKASGVELSFLDFSVTDGGTVIICAEKIINKMNESTENADVDAIDVFGSGLVITSYVCLGLSAFALFATFITYCIFPSLRTLPGMCTMALVLTMFVAIVLFLVGGVFSDMTAVCQTVGVVTHFFLMSSFTWMVICTAHMYRVFAHVMEHHSNEEKNTRKFNLYFSISVIIPAAIVASTIIGNYFTASREDYKDTVNSTNSKNTILLTKDEQTTPLTDCYVTDTLIGYGDGICYVSNKYSLLLASAMPIILLCVINLAMFGMTICALRKMTAHQKLVKKEAQSNIYLYVKLSTLTGINWLPCTVAAFVSSAVIWYTFLVLCGLQGVYVFVSFVLNKRVLTMYGNLFRKDQAYSTSGASGAHGTQEKYENRHVNVNGNTHSDDVKTSMTDASEGHTPTQK